MKEFLSLVKSASFRLSAHSTALPATPSGLPLFSSYRNIRVNPKFSATAKPETITQLLQIMQPAFA
jgi:hypothetical protein